MSVRSIPAQIQLRSDIESRWNSINPILASNEPGVIIDSGGNFVRMKLGDGVRRWTQLPFATGLNGITPHIGNNRNWWIGDTDTGIRAEGITPRIGANGNWFVGDTDTGVQTQGFSPTIVEKVNEPNKYILEITNRDGSFETPNLIGHYEIIGGRADTNYTGMLHLHGGNAESA